MAIGMIFSCFGPMQNTNSDVEATKRKTERQFCVGLFSHWIDCLLTNFHFLRAIVDFHSFDF